MIDNTDTNHEAHSGPESYDRRYFLAKCGVFSAVTPPAITMLLSTSLNSSAIAASGNCGFGNGGTDGSTPSGCEDIRR